MSYVLTAIISMIFGAWLALLMRNSGNISAEERAFKDGREYGYAEGHRDGFREGIKRMSAIKNGRVDVAPGVDSVRPSAVGVADKQGDVAHD
jgi:hypothetical protein